MRGSDGPPSAREGKKGNDHAEQDYRAMRTVRRNPQAEGEPHSAALRPQVVEGYKPHGIYTVGRHAQQASPRRAQDAVPVRRLRTEGRQVGEPAEEGHVRPAHQWRPAAAVHGGGRAGRTGHRVAIRPLDEGQEGAVGQRRRRPDRVLPAGAGEVAHRPEAGNNSRRGHGVHAAPRRGTGQLGRLRRRTEPVPAPAGRDRPGARQATEERLRMEQDGAARRDRTDPGRCRDGGPGGRTRG